MRPRAGREQKVGAKGRFLAAENDAVSPVPDDSSDGPQTADRKAAVALASPPQGFPAHAGATAGGLARMTRNELARA